MAKTKKNKNTDKIESQVDPIAETIDQEQDTALESTLEVELAPIEKEEAKDDDIEKSTQIIQESIIEQCKVLAENSIDLLSGEELKDLNKGSFEKRLSDEINKKNQGLYAQLVAISRGMEYILVKAKNNIGLLAIGKYEDMAILEVIIPKITSGILSDVNIDNINIGDEINVIVCGKKFTLYDKMISIIGRIIKDKNNDDINVIEEDEDDSPSIDEEEDEQLSYIDDELIDDDLYDDEEEDDETDNVRKIIIDDDIVKSKGGEFNLFEEDEEEEEEEELDDELEEDAEDDLYEDLEEDDGQYLSDGYD